MSRAPRKTNRKAEGRQERIPLGQARPKMARVARPGMVGRWINDTGGRIADAERAGYAHVMESTTPDGEKRPVSMTVGTAESGGVLTAFYMEIPEKLYRADQKVKQRDIDLTDEAIHRGNLKGEAGDDGRYVPEGGISIRRA